MKTFKDDASINWRTGILVIIWPHKLQDMLNRRTGVLVSFIMQQLQDMSSIDDSNGVRFFYASGTINFGTIMIFLCFQKDAFYVSSYASIS